MRPSTERDLGEAPPPRSSQTSAFDATPKRSFVWPLVVGVFALAVSWLAWSVAEGQARRSREANFDFRVRDARQRIEHRLETYEEVLRATRAHFLTSEVTRAGFRQFVATLGLAESYPGFQGLGYAEVVPRAALESVVARVRAEGYPAYAVRPAGERETYTAIVLLEPLAGRNLRAFGFDMYSEPVRRAAMERSIALDDIVASGLVRLVQETDQDVQAGFLIYVPVFAPGAERGRPSSGALAAAPGLRGWVYAPFRMNDFMAGVLGEREDELEIELFDGETRAPASLLFRGRAAAATEPVDPRLHAELRLEIAHHPWTLSVRPTPRFAASLGPDRSAGIAAAGLLASVLLVALTWSLTRARGRAASELRRVVREQEIILETANAGIDMVVGRRQVWANRWIEETFGYSRAEIVGQSTRMYYPSDEAFEDFGRRAYAELANGGAYHALVELRRKDGTPVWTQYNGRAVDPHDLSKGTLWVLTDETAKREADEALRKSEARFRHLFESHGAVMLLVDPAGGAIVDANLAAERFYGFTRAALRSKNIADVNALARDPLEAAMSAAAQARQDSFVFPHRLASGEIRTVDVSSSPVEIDGRSLLFSIVRDVTERELAQASLLRERQRYRSLLTIAQDGIHLLDERGDLVEANEAFMRLLGRAPDAIAGLNVRDWDAEIPPGQLESRLRALLDHPSLFRTRHRRADGVVFDVEVHAGPILLDGKRYLLAASRDITARIEFERALGEKQGQLEELNRSLEARVAEAVGELRAKDQLLVTQNRQAAMGEMIGNIAHQWRQPLNALGLVLANLVDAARFEELDEAAVESAARDGRRLIEKMSTTINDFRDFFRPARAKSAFSALAQVKETLSLVDASFQSAEIDLEIEGGGESYVFGFANEYSQVLLNLLSNAKQAIQGAGVSKGRVTLRLTTCEGAACLSVRDNGGGVPAAIVDRIFEPYFSTKEAGTGIGLYMSRQIVERSLGGRIEFRNVEGGAEFTVRTPLAPAPK